MKTVFVIITTLFMTGFVSAGIGPVEIVDRDSTCLLSLKFAGQLRCQFESNDKGGSTNRSEKVYMEARRIRPVMSLTLREYNLSFRLHLSTAPGSLELMDFYFDYHCKRKLSFRLGQYKVPFTRYRIQSFQRLTLADWAAVTKYFGAERQFGVAVHNGYEKPPPWGYAIGLFTGVNARASHAVGLETIYGEPISNPSDLADAGTRSEFHPELFVHLSYIHGNMDIASDTDARMTGLRWFLAAGAAWDFKPVLYRDLRLRLAQEVMVKYRGLAMTAIVYAGYVREKISKDNKLAMQGGLIQGAWRVNKSWELAGRLALIDLSDWLIDDAYARAQQLISAAQEALDNADEKELAQLYLDEIQRVYRNAGRVRREQEFLLGINIYFDGHYLKLQNDFGWLKHTLRDESREDYIIRLQLQVAF